MSKILNTLKINIFADGASKKDILELNSKDFIKGFTTNPSLMKKSGITDYEKFSKDILQIVNKKPFSLEVFADDFEEIEKQARKISQWGENVYVKIPISNSKGKKSISLIKKLSNEGVKLNITAIFTIKQIEETIDALNKNVNSIISIFAGRIADTGIDPVPYIIRAKDLIGDNDNLMTLWASTRQIYSIFEADKVGCKIITVPHEMLNKLDVLGKNLEEYSLDTVNQFYKDAISSNFKI